jgi:hypothetical protein
MIRFFPPVEAENNFDLRSLLTIPLFFAALSAGYLNGKFGSPVNASGMPFVSELMMVYILLRLPREHARTGCFTAAAGFCIGFLLAVASAHIAPAMQRLEL